MMTKIRRLSGILIAVLLLNAVAVVLRSCSTPAKVFTPVPDTRRPVTDTSQHLADNSRHAPDTTRHLPDNSRIRPDDSRVADKPKSVVAKAAVTDIVQAGIVSSLAGNTFPGYFEGTGIQALFNSPVGIAADAAGNIYVADKNNHRIRKLTPGGTSSTFAGNGTAGFADGAALAAQFSSPMGVALDAAGNLYVAEQGNHRIRKITPAGMVSTVAGNGSQGFTEGPALSAQFNSPTGLAINAAGTIYVADAGNHRIRKISTAGLVTTLAGNGIAGFGDGPPTFAQFNNPTGVVVDAAGIIYVADNYNERIRRVTASGVVTTLAGSGTAGYLDADSTSAQFDYPFGIAMDAGGNIYVSDTYNNRIRKINTAKKVSTVAGASTSGFYDGPSSIAQFNAPLAVAIDPAGNLYVTDVNNGRIRKIAQVPAVATMAGNGTSGFADGIATAAQFSFPTATAVDADGNVYVADTYNNRIRKITNAGQVSTLAGDGTAGYAEGTGAVARFNHPYGVAIDAARNVYVADQANNRIRKITPAGVVSTLAGSGVGGFADGTGTAAQFNSPYSVAVDAAGNVYVADRTNCRIRKITPAAVVSTMAGNGTAGYAEGAGTAAMFNYPNSVTVDGAGNVYVADSYNQRVRKVTPAGQVSTFAGGTFGFADGTGAAAQFRYPYGVAADSVGNVYVVDQGNYRIRKITPAGMVTTLAGRDVAGFFDGPDSWAQFNSCFSLCIAPFGTLYIADTYNHRIRKMQ